jgi:hypothetical protein
LQYVLQQIASWVDAAISLQKKLLEEETFFRLGAYQYAGSNYQDSRPFFEERMDAKTFL